MANPIPGFMPGKLTQEAYEVRRDACTESFLQALKATREWQEMNTQKQTRRLRRKTVRTWSTLFFLAVAVWILLAARKAFHQPLQVKRGPAASVVALVANGCRYDC